MYKDKLNKYDIVSLIHFYSFFMMEKLDICMSTKQQSQF